MSQHLNKGLQKFIAQTLYSKRKKFWEDWKLTNHLQPLIFIFIGLFFVSNLSKKKRKKGGIAWGKRKVQRDKQENCENLKQKKNNS